MSLRRRTVLTVGTALLIFMAGSFIATSLIVDEHFDHFEEHFVLSSIERATRALNDELSTLNATARDWAAWDDSYAFMVNRSEQYLKSNINQETLDNLHLSFLALITPEGEVVAGERRDLNTGQALPLDEAFRTWARTVPTPPENNNPKVQGFLVTPDGVTLIASAPILTSAMKGPSRGSILLGRILTAQEIARIERVTLLEFTIEPLSNVELPPSIQEAADALTTDSEPLVRILSQEYTAGYCKLRDLQGKPSVLLQIKMKRETQPFRMELRRIAMASMFAIGMLVTIIAMVVLDRLVLRRLMALSRDLNKVTDAGEPSSRVNVGPQKDELSSLAGEVNTMLAALERSREDLQASEAVARALLDAPDSPAVLLDPAGRILGLNRRAALYLQSRSLKNKSQCAPASQNEGVYPGLADEIRAVVDSAQPLSCEESDAAGRLFIHSLYPITSGSGAVMQVAVFTRDVTEQRRAAEALEESERRYRDFVRNSHGIVFQSRRDGRPVLCQGNVEPVTGYTEADFMSGATHWRRIIHPDDAADVDNQWAFLVAHASTTLQGRYRIVRKDGKVRWLQAFLQSNPGPNGDTKFIQGVLYDITERVTDEQALRESLQTTSDIVGAIPSGLVTFRYQEPDRFMLIDFNPEAERLTGIPMANLRGREFRDIWPSDNALPILGAMQEVIRTQRLFESDEFEYRGEHVHWAFRVRMFPLQGDKLAVAFEDTLRRRHAEHERKRLEEQLHQAQKMEAIGQLAGGVAHDFNNLLGGILGYASLLRLDSGASPVVVEAARTIEQAAERAADLTRQLLGFARHGKFQNAVVNLHDTIREVVHLLERTLDKNIRIKLHLNAECANVMGDPNQLQQVLVNLALNARDAMPDGGELTFESSMTHREDVVPDLFESHHEQDCVIISVTDQGCGIPSEHLDRVFEPFFTTKEQGKGTGMGLAMVYGIVKNHNGLVRVYSELGLGTTFRVYLPAAPTHHTEESSRVQHDEPRKGKGHILLVDDEAIIRNMGSTVLARLGYTVTALDDGRLAVDYYRENGHKVDLVILDMVMPEMSGQDCYRELKMLNPKVRALLSSGYNFNGKVSEMLEEGMLGFIPKPYRVTELSVAVAQALETRDGGAALESSEARQS